MKRILKLISLTAFGGVCLMSCNDANKIKYDVVSGQPDFASKQAENVLRVGAWVAPPAENWNNKGNPNFITQERYNEIAESGIHVIYALYEIGNRTAMKNALEYAKNAGIEYLARDYIDLDPDLLELEKGDLHNITKSYDDAEALRGFLVTDEPEASRFDSLTKLKELYE